MVLSRSFRLFLCIFLFVSRTLGFSKVSCFLFFTFLVDLFTVFQGFLLVSNQSFWKDDFPIEKTFNHQVGNVVFFSLWTNRVLEGLSTCDMFSVG